MAGGHLPKDHEPVWRVRPSGDRYCSICAKVHYERNRASRYDTPEKRKSAYEAVKRYRLRHPDYKGYRTEYHKKHPERRTLSMLRRKERDPEKFRARQETRQAIKSGKLVRPDHCTKCGLVCKPQAHHPDYSKPLEIIWICEPCHLMVHGKGDKGWSADPLRRKMLWGARP